MLTVWIKLISELRVMESSFVRREEVVKALCKMDCSKERMVLLLNLRLVT